MAHDDNGEDAGWLLSVVTATAPHPRLDVLDATTMARVAYVDLPYRVPATFPGNWRPDADEHALWTGNGGGQARWAGVTDRPDT
jgi:Retinal pigment epithelial membrane protein